MSCIQLPSVSVPSLELLIPSLSISTPGIGLELGLCCNLSLPIHIPILSLSLIPGIGDALAPLMTVLTETTDAINAILDMTQVECPLE